MENRVLLKRNGLILNNEGAIIKKEDILEYINIPINLDKKYTLRSYFKLVGIYQDKEVHATKLYPFWIEYTECPKAKCLIKNIKYIRISKYMKVAEDTFGKTNYYSYMCGVDREGCEYILDFFLLKETIDIPLLVGNMRIEEDNIDSETAEMSKFTLFEFLNSITNQLTTYVSPKEREEVFKEIVKKAH